MSLSLHDGEPHSPFHRVFNRGASAPSLPAAPPTPTSSSSEYLPATMGRTDATHQTTKSHLDIVLDTPFINLKGTGLDVEPSSLSGHVALYLAESTSIKEITLQFRGKAKIPMPASESLINSSTFITYVVCNHDWSFLEGDKRHSRTLKAGRHYFSFHLEIGGSLPSSISTSAFGGASVAYKLQAVAQRPGLAHNLQTIAPVHILRSFTHEALEYQQTLEIENTWPEKLMYAIMLPHKAWAAGDALVAVLKFSPLAKGVSVSSIVSSLHETTKVYARSGAQEETRIVCSVRHEIIEGRAVEIDGPSSGNAHDKTRMGQAFSFASAAASIAATPASSRPSSAQGNYRTLASTGASSSTAPHSDHNSHHNHTDDVEDDFENHDVVTYVRMHIPPSTYTPSSSNTATTAPSPHLPPTTSGVAPIPLIPVPGTFGFLDSVPVSLGTYVTPPTSPGGSAEHYFPSPTASPPSSPPPSAHSILHHQPHPPQQQQQQHAQHAHQQTNAHHKPTTLVTPSHMLEPIVVSHRVRWSIFLRNRDGHTSELRCSLPVIILDGRVREEARSMSLPTRRMMLGSVGLGREAVERASGGDIDGGLGLGSHHGDAEVEEDDNDDDAGLLGDRELPSYNAHVRDRVANMFLPEAVTMRVTNPWLNRIASAPATAFPSALASGSQLQHMQMNASLSAPMTPGEERNEHAILSGNNSNNNNNNSPGEGGPVRNTSARDVTAATTTSTSGPGKPTMVPRAFSTASITQAPNSSPPHHTHALGPANAHANASQNQNQDPNANAGRVPLDWVNSELLLSLSDEPLRRLGVAGADSPTSAGGQGAGAGGGHSPVLPPLGMRTPPVQPQFVASQSVLGGSGGSRGGSRWGSRAGSRAGSPERGLVLGMSVLGSEGGGERHERHSPGGHGHGQGGGLGEGRRSRTSSRAASPVRAMSGASLASASGGGAGATSGGANTPPAAFGYGYEALPSPVIPVSSASSSSHGHSHGHVQQQQQQGQGQGSLHQSTSSASSSHGHGHGHGVRNLQSLFKATMKPFTALTHHHHHGSKDRNPKDDHHTHADAMSYGGAQGRPSGDYGRDAPGNVYAESDASSSMFSDASSSTTTTGGNHRQQQQVHFRHPTGAQSTSALPGPPGSSYPTTSDHAHTHIHPSGTITSMPPSSAASTASLSLYSTHSHNHEPMSGPQLLQRAFTEVPGYAVAARGFIGGVPPLSSMRGLPSYEEAQRERSDAKGGADAGERTREVEDEEDEEEERGIEMRRRRT